MLPFLKQNSYLLSSLSPLRAIFIFNPSICRLLSIASQEAPSESPASDFAVEYLIKSCRESLVSNVRRAEELGFPRLSGNFVHALNVVSSLKQSTIDARLLYWRSLGFSPEELTLIICKSPQVLGYSENVIGCKMEFLINEAVCDKLHVVRNPALLMYSLEKRLMPRILVWKLLESKGFPVKALASFMVLNEVRFVEKFVLPYEHAIPGLHQAYRDACSGNVSGLKFLQKTSS